MSYDISFKVRVHDTDKYITVGDCQANITWNVRKIIELSTGLPWENEKNNGYCIDIIPKIQDGLNNLISHPEDYKKYESDNGWGTISGVKNFYIDIINSWLDFVKYEDKDIVNKTTFWIG